MIFRFRQYIESENKYKYITSCDIEDFDKMYKTLTFMKEHECMDCIELNTENVVDALCDMYNVEGIALSVSESIGEDGLVPIFVVDIV